MAILDFSVSGWHGFGSVTQVCFGISVSNFMCMSFVALDRSLTIVSYVTFKMAALWFWTMPPSPMGWGILVDHWSTISSYIYHSRWFDNFLFRNGYILVDKLNTWHYKQSMLIHTLLLAPSVEYSINPWNHFYQHTLIDGPVGDITPQTHTNQQT